MCSIPLVDMDAPLISHRRRSAAMIVVVAIWCFLWFRHRRQQAHSITYDPMFKRDIQRQNNLQFMFLSDDIHCVNLLKMRRAPIFQLCNLFRDRGLLQDSINNTIEEQVTMFLHVVWDITKDLG
jgi:hypothetical protein